MIVLHNDKNKIYLTVFLTVIVFIGLIITWQKLSVSSRAAVKNESISEDLINSSIVKDIENSLELGKLQWNDLQEQIIKAQKQQALLQAAQEYLNNKASSTATSTLQPTSTATTSIK